MNKQALSVLIILVAIIIVGTSAATLTATPAGQSGTAAATLGATAPATAVATAAAVQEFTLINLNTATAEQLMTIPGMNNRMVREFFEYRPYISILQFRREIGKYVDAAQVAAYEKYVYVPIKVDEVDAATLMQIPGVDDKIAGELIAARPYGSDEAFLERLGTYLSVSQVAYAKNYLEAQ